MPNSVRYWRRKSPAPTTWTRPARMLNWTSSCCFLQSPARRGIRVQPITRPRMDLWTSLRRIAIGRWPRAVDQLAVVAGWGDADRSGEPGTAATNHGHAAYADGNGPGSVLSQPDVAL